MGIVQSRDITALSLPLGSPEGLRQRLLYDTFLGQFSTDIASTGESRKHSIM
jgi:hypothetical protein